MLTKREACLAVIGDFCMTNRIGPDDLTDEHIYASSKLAVAMEYLDLIGGKKGKEFATGRGGTLDEVVLYYFSDSGVKTLSFREILDLLPEDKQKGEIKWRDLKGKIKWRDLK